MPAIKTCPQFAVDASARAFCVIWIDILVTSAPATSALGVIVRPRCRVIRTMVGSSRRPRSPSVAKVPRRLAGLAATLIAAVMITLAMLGSGAVPVMN